jgi:serine protease AprX
MSSTGSVTGRRSWAAVLVAALAMGAVGGAGHAPGQPAPWQDVVVSGQPGALHAVELAVRNVGGQVRSTLGVIEGVAARVPVGAAASLRAMPGVRAVSSDAHGHLMGLDSTLGYDVGADVGSVYNVAQVTHAKDAWTKGYTGQGIDVALIDSGVAPVLGLTSGNVVNGPDLSFESQDPNLSHLDTYGHGTHMASIIVGREAAATGSTYAKADNHQFVGVAPDARLVSLKVASADGGADVSQVIAAIDWVTQNRHSNGLNIKVLNLSYGTDSAQSVVLDPLDYAVENAWRAGITVIVSAGNDGTNRAALADPANDPLVLAVGADDPKTTDSVGDDLVPTFSQRGTSARHVDVIAPGMHVLGLRNPGSFIDQANPQAVVNSRFFRGSGTSQAAAVTSGLAAVYLSRYPNATPDQVKYALMHNATPPSSVKPLFAGLGVPDVNKALAAPLPVSVQAASGSTGTGSLEAARGSAHVYDGYATLTGELDIFGQTWNPTAWAAASAAGTAWSAGSWDGHTWTANTWDGASWASAVWDGHTWTGHTWTGHTWTGHTWTDAGWDGHTWTGSGWSANSWAGSTWSASQWG